MATSKLSLKLLIDKKGQRVLFAEAGKEFVDFLFSLLTLPIGTILSVVGNKHMAGSLPMIFKSVSDLDNEYVKSGQKKNGLLKPTPSLPFVPPQVPLLPIKEWCSSSKSEEKGFNASPFRFTPSPDFSGSSTAKPTLYKCGACKSPMLSTTYGPRCTYSLGFGGVCGREMTTLLADYVSASPGDTPGGFVKGLVTYMVEDDLSVSPMSTILHISLLNKFNIKDLGAVEAKVVQIGTDEGLELLRQSLNSKTVLTNVFLDGDKATKVKNPQEV